MPNSQTNSSSINNSQFKKHFERLFRTTLTEKNIYRLPLQADIDKSISRNLIKDSDGNIFSLCCDLSELTIFGPGVYLLFRFLKLLVLLFAVMGILTMINVALLASGSYMRQQKLTFSVLMATTTIGNIQESFSEVVPLFYFFCLIIFTVCMVYWRQIQPHEVLVCSKKQLLPSYYSVVLDPIPEGYSQTEIKAFLEENYGEVRQIFSVKQFNDDLFHYKQISQIIHEYKIQHSILNTYKQDQIDKKDKPQEQKSDASTEPEVKAQRSRQRMVDLFNQFFQYYLKVINWKKNKYQPVLAFITFQKVADRQALLQIQNQKQAACCKRQQISDEPLYKGQALSFNDCDVEPNAISWENISLSARHNCLRMSLQIILLFIAFVIGISIVYILALAQNNISSFSQIHDINSALEIGTEDALKQYCISLSISNFSKQPLCHEHTGLFVKVILLELLLPLLIAIIKFLFVELMKHLVSVRRHPTEITKIESQILITFIFYFAVLGILQLLIDIEVNAGQTGISINRFFHQLAADIYNLLPVGSARPQTDFTRQWFINNSGKIILGALLSFNFSSIIDIIYSVGRKAILTRLAARQPTVAQMNDYLKLQTLQIQFIYAFALNIIYFTLLFGAVMPLLWILGSISCALLYLIQKLIFLRFCSHPLIFSHSINHIVTRLVLLGIMLSTVITPILYGGVIISDSSIGQRFITFIYYPILGVAILIYLFARRYWSSCIQSILNILKTKEHSQKRLPTVLCQMRQATNTLASYSMHSNPDYQSILKVLYTLNSTERHRQTFLMNKNLKQFLSKSRQDGELSPFQSLLNQVKTCSSRNYQKKWSGSQQRYKKVLQVQKNISNKKQVRKFPPIMNLDQIVEDVDSSLQEQSQSDRRFTQSMQNRPKSFFNTQFQAKNSQEGTNSF